MRLLLVLGGFAVATLASADSWAPPQPQVYKSSNGQYLFRTEPKGATFLGAASATLKSKLGKDGAEEKVWEAKLVNTPYKAFVSDDGKHVVTIDTYANLGYTHALVLYGAKGKVVADYDLEALLTNDEIAKHVRRTAGSRWWAGDARFSFDPMQPHFVVNMKWGKEVRISLANGKILMR
jgi:hypothetical protein